MKPEGLPFPVREALCFERQAQLSPLPFLAALLPELTVYEHSPVRDIRGHAVRCDGGTVTAEQIVVATHFPMLERFGLYDLRLRQERSYLLALTGAPPRPGMWLDAVRRAGACGAAGAICSSAEAGTAAAKTSATATTVCARRRSGFFPQRRRRSPGPRRTA